MPSSLLALIDDISTILDDVSLLAKVAHKTSGVVGDDLALNAQQVAGVRPERELPVVFAVAKGSLVNKAILVPAALAISAFAPWAVTVLLMIGGAFLCYEGFEKLAHRLLHSREEDAAHRQELARGLADPAKDPREIERDKIRGAIRTDFVLSAEIIVIALGTVAGTSLPQQVFVLAGVAIAMTVGVYGLVALIVKLDDFGLYLSRRSHALPQRVGRGIVRAAPALMKVLAVVGTAAMFAVGGGILVHGITPLHHAIESLGDAAMVSLVANIVAGIIAGAIVLGAVTLVRRGPRKR
jgi:predicted DNA repair protein MutK